MTIQITREGLKAILPGAPASIIDNVPGWQAAMDKAGITQSRNRMADFFANIEHETNGFRIKGLTESMAYSAERAAEIWPSRFRSAADVRAKFGTGPGWQMKLFNDVYGGRMGNVAGTNDGSHFIGRGGPQWTGRDGYTNLARITGLQVVQTPELVAKLEHQPAVCAAFVQWKNLNPVSDVGDRTKYRRLWNGGLIGNEDVKARRQGNQVAIDMMPDVARVLTQTKMLPGTPGDVNKAVTEATDKERKVRNAGVGTTGASATVEVAKPADTPLVPSFATYAIAGIGIAVVIIAVVLIVKKTNAVKNNWF